MLITNADLIGCRSGYAAPPYRAPSLIWDPSRGCPPARFGKHAGYTATLRLRLGPGAYVSAVWRNMIEGADRFRGTSDCAGAVPALASARKASDVSDPGFGREIDLMPPKSELSKR